MKLVILILLSLTAAIGLAMFAMEDPGYVVLSREPYTVRLPLALFILFALAAFAVLYLLINFIFSLFAAPKKIGKWNKSRKEVSAQQHTMKGFAGLIEGEWSQAEGNLLTKLDHNNAALMNYLGAAYAAQQQGQIERRNQHLEDALKAHPGQELAIKLTRARMQYQAGELADARAQLEYLRLSAPRSVAVARLLADVYQQLGDWPALVKLMPALGKMKAFPEEEFATRQKLALENHIEAPALLQGDGTRIEETFKALPRKAKKEAAALGSYARQLVRSGENQRAETVLRKSLNKSWNEDLLAIYGANETTHVKDQIKLVETWAAKYDKKHSPAYKLAMARLLQRNEQPEDARDLYAAVVQDTGSAEAIAELGELLEQMGDPESALLAYKQGVKALGGRSVLTPEITQTDTQLIALDGTTGPTADGSTMPVVADAVVEATVEEKPA